MRIVIRSRTVKETQQLAAEAEREAPDASEVRRAFLQQQASVLQPWVVRVADHRIKVAELLRQAAEDLRANRRNRNRFLTLVVAVVMAVIVPAVMPLLGNTGTFLATHGYLTAIIIIPDVAVTAWAYLRRY